MGTRADFYIGRGRGAEWLGSIAFDGYPDGIDAQLLNCKSADTFRPALADFAHGRSDFTKPEMGWPWPWVDSCTTDYAYAFDGESVWVSCFGSPWVSMPDALNKDDAFEESSRKGAEFPNMKARMAVTFGERSGLIVVTGPA